MVVKQEMVFVLCMPAVVRKKDAISEVAIDCVIENNNCQNLGFFGLTRRYANCEVWNKFKLCIFVVF